MDKLKYIKLENEDGSYSDSIPLAVDSDHVDVNGNTLTNELKSKASIGLVNSNVNNLQNQINSLASGSPLVASSTSEMTDTTRIYVNTTDGHWYWYDGSNWEDGGVYQSTALGNKSVTFTKLNKDITGSEYHITSSGSSYPRILFEFDMLQSVLKVRIKLKIKKEIISPSSQIRLRLLRGFNPGTGREYAYQEHIIVTSSSELSQKYIEIDKSFDLSTEFVDCNAIQIRVNNSATSLITDWFVSDVQLWLNDIPIDLLYNKTDKYNTLTEDISEAFSFLATKQYVNKIIEIFNETFDNKIAELDNVINIDSLTKSDLYNITCWGDSITEGGSPGSPYPTYLQNLLGENVVVNNKGVSGECSGIIAFRQGGNVIETNESFTIPTSGASAAFTMKFSSGFANNFSNDNGKIKVSILDIEGKLDITARDASTATITGTFTRDTDGIEVSVPSGTKVVSLQDLYADNMSIIWVGRNDMAFAWPHQIDGVLANVKSMIEHLSTDIKRFLVVSCTTTTQEVEGGQSHSWVTNYNKQLKELYPNNFIDIESYLVNQCIYDAGITPTAEDLEKMEAKTIPPSLMASDGIHPNDTAKQYIARYIYNEMQKRDWLR